MVLIVVCHLRTPDYFIYRITVSSFLLEPRGFIVPGSKFAMKEDTNFSTKPF